MKLNITEQATNILDLLRTGSEAIEFLNHKHNSGTLYEVSYLFADINELVDSIQRGIESLQYKKPLTRLSDIINNVFDQVNNIQNSISMTEVEAIDFKLRSILPALYLLLKNEVALLLENCVDKTMFADFYPESVPVNKEDIIKEIRETKPMTSLVVLAYNKLDYTKQCIESILAYTKDCNYELILVNNGSTDGTEAFFDSILNAKKVHLKYNIGATLGFNIGMMLAEGKHVAALGNDIIFTHNWLNNLITCIESDENFGYVAPAATYMSNHQQINVEFKRIEEFHEFASQYNVSDPSKWEERVVLMPTVLLIPTALMKRINYFDARYYYGEFADDDISFKVRRAGFKCVYSRDTVIHHFGHVTTGHDQSANKSLEVSRLIFKEKYGLDAWDDARFDVNLMNMSDLKTIIGSILGIDVKCGGTPLQIKNMLRDRGQNSVEISLFTTEEKYYTDLKTVSDKVTYDASIHNLSEYYHKEKFDMILIERPMDEYDEISFKRMLTVLKPLLKQNGQLLLKVNNPSYFYHIYRLMQGVSYYNAGSKVYTTSHIEQCVSELGFSHLSVTLSKVSKDNAFVSELAKLVKNNETQSNREQLLLTKEILYRIS